MIKKKIRGSEAAGILKKGGIGILKTDTIYGVLGSALLPKTAERIYKPACRQAGCGATISKNR